MILGSKDPQAHRDLQDPEGPMDLLDIPEHPDLLVHRVHLVILDQVDLVVHRAHLVRLASLELQDHLEVLDHQAIQVQLGAPDSVAHLGCPVLLDLMDNRDCPEFQVIVDILDLVVLQE